MKNININYEELTTAYEIIEWQQRIRKLRLNSSAYYVNVLYFSSV